MNYTKQFQDVLNYIETHLEQEISYDDLAKMVGYSTYHFQRLFLLLTGVSTAEYIRNRRLSKAAAELLGGANSVLDTSLKYGYSSPTAFNRAFKTMHGIAPSEIKTDGVNVKAFPPLTLDPSLKAAEKIEYRIQTMDAFRIVGLRLTSTMEGGACYKEIPAFWQALMQNGGPIHLLPLMNQMPMGLLGISAYDPESEDSHFDYYIAVSTDQPVPEGMETYTVPASTWAVFSHRNNEPDVIQSFQKKIVLDWLPTSGYEFAKAPDVELYYEDDRMETWIPITNIK